MKTAWAPTPRAAIVAAAGAPVALLVAALAPAAWVVAPIAAVLLVTLVLIDGAAAGQLRDLRLHVPADVEIGTPFAVTLIADLDRGHQVAAALACDARLAPGGRADAALTHQPDGSWQARFELAATRRGTAAVDAVWLRRAGPLGLGQRQTRVPIEQAVRVWPDLSPIRSGALQAHMRDARVGLVARRIRGDGTQFEALAEYEPGMDRRRIDWKRSARHAHLLARENEAERDNQIVFAFDCGAAMCAQVDGLPRLDRAISAALAAAYVALKAGDRVALFGFARRPGPVTPFVTQAQGFHRLQVAAAALDYRSEEPNFTFAMATLGTRLQRRSLILLFSDFANPTGAELMLESVGRLTARHVVLFVTLADAELEGLAATVPDSVAALATAVAADTLARQRATVLQRLRHLGVDVIEAPWDRIGYRLIDAYFDVKHRGLIG